jgi:hypothetical protein
MKEEANRMSNLPTALKTVLDKHVPFDTSSARAIQRTIALFVGHTTKGKIDPATLRDLCDKADLFSIEAGKGPTGGYAGRNTFGANFCSNMVKDSAYFDGDKTGWKLTSEGKAEAKRIFDKGEAPTKRRTKKTKASTTSTKTKTVKKTKATKTKAKKTKASKSAKKTKASKSTSKSTTKKTSKGKASTPTRASRKAAQRRKKRDLAPEPAAATPAPEPATAAAE